MVHLFRMADNTRMQGHDLAEKVKINVDEKENVGIGEALAVIGPLPIVTLMPLPQILLWPTIQARLRTCDDVVAKYAERMRAGDQFPPIVAFRIEEKPVLADGGHRLKAAEQADLKTILVEFRCGTRQDAIRYALQANATHGLPLSREDKAHAVRMAFNELGNVSARLVAEWIGVSPTFSSKILKGISRGDTSLRLGIDGKRRRGPRPKSDAEMAGQAVRRLKAKVEAELAALSPAGAMLFVKGANVFLAEAASRLPAPKCAGQESGPGCEKQISAPPLEFRESRPSQLTFTGLVMKVLGDAGRPLSIEEIRAAAEPLLPLIHTKGKTPLDSVAAKTYVAAKKGILIKENGKFSLPVSRI